MEFFNPNFEGFSKIKKRRGLKKHTALAMIKRLGFQVFFFTNITELTKIFSYGLAIP
jgi:hypothetical protein